MTQHQSSAPEGGPAIAPARSGLLLPLLSAFVLVVAFFAINARRLPFDSPPSYDEATHLVEGWEVREAIADRDFDRLADYFLTKKVMKGVLYRVWYGVAFLVQQPSLDAGRRAGLVACGLALLAIFFLARVLADPRHRAIVPVVAVALAAGAPLLHEQGRRAMVEAFNLLTLVVALTLLVVDRRSSTWRSACFAALGLVVAIATKYNHAVILIAAVGIDGVLTAWGRRGESWRAKLRPFLPLAIAAAPLALFLASPARLKGAIYYVMTVPGGQNPIDPSGSLYFHTLLEKMAPWTGGCVLVLGCAILGAVVAIRSGRPGARLVAIHCVLGLVLAQLNDLKLERIIVPLTGAFFVFAADGAVSLVTRVMALRPSRGLGAAALLVIVVVGAWVGVPSRALYAIEPHPLRPTEAWLDKGIAFTLANPKTLWLGGDFGDNIIWNSATVRLRAIETGVELPLDTFGFGGSEFFQKSRIDAPALKSGAADEKLAKLLAPYRSLVVVLDPSPKAPAIREVVARNAFARLVESGEWERAPMQADQRLSLGTESRPSIARIELWRRVGRH